MKLHSLSRFRALKKLHIHAIADSIFCTGLRENVYFHSLEHLTLSGSVPLRLILALDIQKLSRLTLDEGSCIWTWKIFPQAKVFTIAEDVFYRANPNRNEPESKAMLSSLLSQLKITHSLDIRLYALLDIAEVITSLRADGGLQQLRSVASCSKEGRRTVMSIPPANGSEFSSISVSDGAGHNLGRD